MKILINEIVIGDRSRVDMGEDMEQLQESIHKRGLINPICITKEKHELIAGFRRLTCCRNLGHTEIEVKFYEELSDLGVIKGVHGRLRDLVKIEKGYRQAIEATAAGWLDAMVVQNYDTAFTCAETLKHMKLGRIKIIPLKEMSSIESIKPSLVRGVNGSASHFVRHAKKFEPAINFVFGDTLVTTDDKTVFATSRNLSKHHATLRNLFLRFQLRK